MLSARCRTSRRGDVEFVSSSAPTMAELHRAFARTAARRRHLDQANLLRSLTLVINGVPGGINLGQGVCDLDPPRPLVDGAIASIDGGDRQLYTPYAGLPELREAIASKLRRHNGLDYQAENCLLYTSPSPRDRTRSRMPSSA